ncbi:MAG: glycoside hydrolase family 36 protein [Bacteroidota bacterium]
MKSNNPVWLVLFVAASALPGSCDKPVVITSGDLKIEFDKNMFSRVNSLHPGTAPFQEEFMRTDYLETKNFTTGEFKVTGVLTTPLEGPPGTGEETRITGFAGMEEVGLQKIVSARTFADFPNMVLFEVSYVNCGLQQIRVQGWTNHGYHIRAQETDPGFWSFQGSSSDARADWVLPLEPGFFQENFMGMNQTDYGGGIPVSDLWRQDGGLAVGHLEPVPKEVSLPVDYDLYSGEARVGIQNSCKGGIELAVGDTLTTLHTFVAVHQGDYFETLRRYSKLMQAGGIAFAPSEEEAFGSIWCGWGYERQFTTTDIIQTLPKVKELGIRWAVIDDGFQIAEGDWRVDTRRFPGGSKDMKKMVDAIHSYGLRAKLWWAPLAADPGSRVLLEHPDALLINEAGAPQYITWWNSYYLSPASGATMTHTLETLKMFLEEWGFDGLKMDGQHMNAVPADYNWERPLEYPEKSIEMLPGFFKTVYESAREMKPHAVIENCPCGTCMSFYNMPYVNQVVSSDPTSSWQIRLKGKTYKAIMPQTAYYGDHVELSDNGSDFASSFGTGAVLGTKFTWPADNPHQEESQLLTPEKEKIWHKWFSLYDRMMLSREQYLGELYDIGYDKPETHVIARGDTLYYAFYNQNWDGNITLRGLHESKDYKAFDYVNEREIASFPGNNPVIHTTFSNYLLLEVYPDH